MSVQGSSIQQHNNLKALGSITGDALTWGAGMAIAGAGLETISQRKMLKNSDTVAGYTKAIKDELLVSEVKPSRKKLLEHSLECLQKGKINFKQVRKAAASYGLWGFIPTLVLNAAIFSVEAGYHKIKNHD